MSGSRSGLSICHGIITQHNGKIYAESEPGHGATFIIELPITPDITIEQEQTKSTTDEMNSIKHNPKKIKGLIVDDEKIILTFLNRLLVGWGYEVETIDRAKEAIDRIRTNDYDFILLDIKMPEINGTKLYRYIEEIKPSLAKKVIFATGDILEKSTSTFLQETKVPHITKPIDIQQLKDNIDAILAIK
jgi:two-component system NtrC family sensor kinase